MVDSANSYSDRVSRLVGWGHWFAFFNIIAAMLIGTRYITQSAWPEHSIRTVLFSGLLGWSLRLFGVRSLPIGVVSHSPLYYRQESYSDLLPSALQQSD